jgi:hypothetical protein
MELHGSVASNLASALQSARRLRGQSVHADTLGHWSDLLRHARRELAAANPDPPVLSLTLELEKELADRS